MNIDTALITITNTDNELSQQQWVALVAALKSAIEPHLAYTMRFTGSDNWEPWQRMYWYASLRTGMADSVRTALIKIMDDHPTKWRHFGLVLSEMELIGFPPQK